MIIFIPNNVLYKSNKKKIETSVMKKNKSKQIK